MKKLLTTLAIVLSISSAHADDMNKGDMVRIFAYSIQTDRLCGTNTSKMVALRLHGLGLEMDDFPNRPVAASMGADEANADMRKQGKHAFCAQFNQ